MRRWLVAVGVVVAAFAADAVAADQPTPVKSLDESRFQAVILSPLVAPSAGPVTVAPWPEHRASAGGPEGDPVAKVAIGAGRVIPPTSPSTTTTANRPVPVEPRSPGPVVTSPPTVRASGGAPSLGSSPWRSGTASWYPARGMIGAVHSWSWGDQPYTVTVCASGCIVVTVSDYCEGCVGGRLIDLSDDAFRLLAPLSAGIVSIEMR